MSFSYFILAISGFFSYFMHTEADSENDPVMMASTLFIASYQALLFTATTLIFIQAAIVKKKLVVIELCVITVMGLALVLSSVFSPNHLFPYLFYTAVLLYLFQLVYYTRLFRREYEKSLKQVEYYYDDDDKRLQWVKYCFYSALGIGILALCSLFMSTFLYGFFILAYTTYYTYIVCRFYNYITDMGFLASALSVEADFVEEIIYAKPMELPEEEKVDLSEKVQQLKAALEKWTKDKQYCQNDISVDHIVLELGTNRDFLRYYFRRYMPSEFRIWRTELRIAEAKRILKENPELSLEEVAPMAGFNCRGNFHRQFLKITGDTPTEYRNNLNKQTGF